MDDCVVFGGSTTRKDGMGELDGLAAGAGGLVSLC